MITNEVRYRSTKAHAARFQEALRTLEADGASGDKRRGLEIAAVRAQLGDLEAELAEYEQLRSGTVRSFEAGSLPELAVALVKARIAKGWSHRRLAEETPLSEVTDSPPHRSESDVRAEDQRAAARSA